ncbi:MAG: DUF2849 domain-containing protein [Alphaproteobacteria bacterium]
MNKKSAIQFEARIITANMLVSGNVLYLDEKRCWDENIANAQIIKNDEDLARLNNMSQDAVMNSIIVGPYVMPVECHSAGLQPVSKRELIRASGPTIPTGFPEKGKPNV